MRYPQKKGLTEKEVESFGSCSAWVEGGVNHLPWRTKDLSREPGVEGKLYRLTIKWTSSKTVVKDFP